jgi:hypothetical protein
MDVAPASGRESASDQLHITSGDSRLPNSCRITEHHQPFSLLYRDLILGSDRLQGGSRYSSPRTSSRSDLKNVGISPFVRGT